MVITSPKSFESNVNLLRQNVLDEIDTIEVIAIHGTAKRIAILSLRDGIAGNRHRITVYK